VSARGARRGLLLLVVAGVVAVLLAPTVKRILSDLTLPLSYESVIRQEAQNEHLNPALVAAVIYAETKFDPRTSPTGALGLMQIEPATAEFLAQRSGATAFSLADLAHPATNIAYGCYYLRYLLNRYRHSETLALAAYNGGETNVDNWLAQAHAAGVRFTLDSIPFAQTRAYVQRVEHAQHQYVQKYGL
jgi:soluble lytic murein transglycosylase